MSHNTAMNTPQLAYLSNSPRLPVLAQMAIAFATVVTKWSMRRRSRNHLSRLSDAHLRDIGVDRLTARSETSLPFWRP